MDKTQPSINKNEETKDDFYDKKSFPFDHKKCPKCGNMVRKSVTTCPYCGYQFPHIPRPPSEKELK